MSLSLTLQMTATASTKRAGGSGTSRTPPAAHLANVPCTPLTPRGVESGTTATEQLETVMPDGTDIRRNDILVVAGRDYPVLEVDVWPWLTRYGQETFLHVVVQDQTR